MKRAALVVALAVLSWSGRASGADISCSADAAAGTVTCTMPDGASIVDLPVLLSLAQRLNVTVGPGSPMILSASGGSGAKGDGNDVAPGGDLGAGGSARMVTTLNDLQATYGTTRLFYYLGAQGEGNHPGGKGGAATLVSIADLSRTTASLANVLLLAGGGGGGGAAGGVYSGHKGGDGGKASGAVGSATSAPGGDGHDGNGSGGGGSGGRGGAGGPGGSAGDGDGAKAGGAGKNGVGGQGGPVHIAHGASTATGWTNVSGVPAGVGTAGEGGEGQVRCDGCGEGGGGGGGYGGGGGGGGGGTSALVSSTAGGGGGGGASWAAPSTTSSAAAVPEGGRSGSFVAVLQGVPGVPDCTMDASSRVVTCALSSGASSLNLKDLLSAAQAANPAIDARSPMAITAFGGSGAAGEGHGGAPGGGAGTGGSARVVTTVRELDGASMLYYYLGRQGDGSHPGGKGGASTLVATADLSTATASAANLLVVAGGGGGGGEAGSPSRPGYAGGAGGSVTSALGTAATASGRRGESGAGSGGGGAGGGIQGGAGGGAGDGSDGKPGGAGSAGFGGQGGPVHVSDGASTAVGWVNVSGVPGGIGASGRGGEGQVRCDACGEGGGGGGGYGGGGGGGGGGYIIEAGGTYTAGGGGGGGGSYAAASTAVTDYEAKRSGHDGSVVVLFEEVCAGSKGEGAATAQKLLDDFVPVFNAQWPAIAAAEGVDPMIPVYDGPVSLGCFSHGGDALCYALHSYFLPVCADVYADVDVSELDGLANLVITDLDLESTHQRVGTSCPMDPAAAAGTSFGCSLYGRSQADVELTAPATVKVPKVVLKIRCTGVGTDTTTLFEGSAVCDSTTGRASGNVDYCGGLCSADQGVASLIALRASDLKMTMKPDCSVHQDYLNGAVGDLFNQILSSLVTSLGDTIVEAVSPAVQGALNDLVKEVLPLPASCQSTAAVPRAP